MIQDKNTTMRQSVAPETKIPTGLLLERLFSTSSISRFIKRFNAESTGFADFHNHVNHLCTVKNLSSSKVVKKADIERKYGLQLFQGTRKPSRDKVIQLAFGFGLGYEETQELLTVARKSALYPKIERDAVIIFALKRKHSLHPVQSMLYELSLPILGEER